MNKFSLLLVMILAFGMVIVGCHDGSSDKSGNNHGIENNDGNSGGGIVNPFWHLEKS